MINNFPLNHAAQRGHLSIVEYLVNHKADMNSQNENFVYLYLIRHPFILPLIMVI